MLKQQTSHYTTITPNVRGVPSSRPPSLLRHKLRSKAACYTGREKNSTGSGNPFYNYSYHNNNRTKSRSGRDSVEFQSNIRDHNYYNFGTMRPFKRNSFNCHGCEKSDTSLSVTFTQAQRRRMNSLPAKIGSQEYLYVGGDRQSSCNLRSDISSSQNSSGEPQGSFSESNVDHRVCDLPCDDLIGQSLVAGSRRGSLSGDISGSIQKRYNVGSSEVVKKNSVDVLQSAVPTPQYTGQNLVVEGTQIKKPALNVPRLHIGHRSGSLNRVAFSNFSNFKQARSLHSSPSSNSSSKLSSLKRSSSDSSLIRNTTSHTTTRPNGRTPVSRKTYRISSARTRSSHDSPTKHTNSASGSEQKAGTYPGPTTRSQTQSIERRSRSRLSVPASLPKGRAVKSDGTKTRVGSQSRQMSGRSNGSREGGNHVTRSPQGRSTSRGSLTLSTTMTHASSRLTSHTAKVGASKYGNRKSVVTLQSPLFMRNGQKSYGAKFLKLMIFKCNYYILEKLPDLHVEQAVVSNDDAQKLFREVTIILPAAVSIYPQVEEKEHKRHFTQYPIGLLKDDEIAEVAVIPIPDRKASFACDYSCGNDSVNSFSFLNGLRGVLKDTTRNFPDSSKHVKNVVFRSPIESAREASFDESMSTLIDGSSAESRELSFLACQLENANLMHDETESTQQYNGMRRNTTQLKRQHYRVLKTLRNLAMQKSEPNLRLANNRSQSVGDLTTLSGTDSGYGSNNGETVDMHDYINCDRPFVPKIFDPSYENMSDNSTILSNLSLNGQSCSTSRPLSVNVTTPVETAKCITRFTNPALNRELTRKHNEMNWKRRQIIQKKQFSVAPTCKVLSTTGHGNLGLTVVGLSHKDNILSSLSQRSLNELSYRYRRKSR